MKKLIILSVAGLSAMLGQYSAWAANPPDKAQLCVNVVNNTSYSWTLTDVSVVNPDEQVDNKQDYSVDNGVYGKQYAVIPANSKPDNVICFKSDHTVNAGFVITDTDSHRYMEKVQFDMHASDGATTIYTTGLYAGNLTTAPKKLAASADIYSTIDSGTKPDFKLTMKNNDAVCNGDWLDTGKTGCVAGFHFTYDKNWGDYRWTLTIGGDPLSGQTIEKPLALTLEKKFPAATVATNSRLNVNPNAVVYHFAITGGGFTNVFSKTGHGETPFINTTPYIIQLSTDQQKWTNYGFVVPNFTPHLSTDSYGKLTFGGATDFYYQFNKSDSKKYIRVVQALVDLPGKNSVELFDPKAVTSDGGYPNFANQTDYNLAAYGPAMDMSLDTLQTSQTINNPTWDKEKPANLPNKIDQRRFTVTLPDSQTSKDYQQIAFYDSNYGQLITNIHRFSSMREVNDTYTAPVQIFQHPNYTAGASADATGNYFYSSDLVPIEQAFIIASCDSKGCNSSDLPAGSVKTLPLTRSPVPSIVQGDAHDSIIGYKLATGGYSTFLHASWGTGEDVAQQQLLFSLSNPVMGIPMVKILPDYLAMTSMRPLSITNLKVDDSMISALQGLGSQVFIGYSVVEDSDKDPGTQAHFYQKQSAVYAIDAVGNLLHTSNYSTFEGR